MMNGSRPPDLDTLQTLYIERIRTSLLRAEQLVDSHRLALAKKRLDDAARSIRMLESLYKRRRNRKRSELEVAISYYSAWHRALVGHAARDQETNPPNLYAILLLTSLSIVEQLQQRHPGAQDFAQLIEKIRKWQNQ